ncbi:MAG: T9SS type A sorting domain-containing protein [Cyclobacteriaceae bacterium]
MMLNLCVVLVHSQSIYLSNFQNDDGGFYRGGDFTNESINTFHWDTLLNGQRGWTNIVIGGVGDNENCDPWYHEDGVKYRDYIKGSWAYVLSEDYDGDCPETVAEISANERFQYLTSPVMDLSDSEYPILSFDLDYNLAYIDDPDYYGEEKWQMANTLWLEYSLDSGQTFHRMEHTELQYTMDWEYNWKEPRYKVWNGYGGSAQPKVLLDSTFLVSNLVFRFVLYKDYNVNATGCVFEDGECFNGMELSGFRLSEGKAGLYFANVIKEFQVPGSLIDSIRPIGFNENVTIYLKDTLDANSFELENNILTSAQWFRTQDRNYYQIVLTAINESNEIVYQGLHDVHVTPLDFSFPSRVSSFVENSLRGYIELNPNLDAIGYFGEVTFDLECSDLDNCPFKMEGNRMVLTKKLNYESWPKSYPINIRIGDSLGNLFNHAGYKINIENIKERLLMSGNELKYKDMNSFIQLDGRLDFSPYPNPADNGQILFELPSGKVDNDLFQVDSLGRLTARQALQDIGEYEIRVKMMDSTGHIFDNFNRIVTIVKKTLSVSIDENSEANTVLEELDIDSLISHYDGDVNYTVNCQADYCPFEVVNGYLVTKEKLNFERQDLHAFDLIVRDSLERILTEIYLIVNVNDQKEDLSLSKYAVTTSFEPGIKVGDLVGSVSHIESGEQEYSGTYKFDLPEGKRDNELFELDSLGGVYLRQAVENAGEYSIRVKMMDSMYHVLDNFNRTVSIVDFISESHEIDVYENTESDIIIWEDSWDFTHYGYVDYKFIDDSIGLFSIDSLGVVKLIRPLDFEKHRSTLNYSVQVTYDDVVLANYDLKINILDIVENVSFNPITQKEKHFYEDFESYDSFTVEPNNKLPINGTWWYTSQGIAPEIGRVWLNQDAAGNKTLAVHRVQDLEKPLANVLTLTIDLDEIEMSNGLFFSFSWFQEDNRDSNDQLFLVREGIQYHLEFLNKPLFEWNHSTIDLMSFFQQKGWSLTGEVRVRFVSSSKYDGVLYLDNISLAEEVLGTDKVALLEESSLPATVVGTFSADIANYDGAVEFVLPDTLDNGDFQIDASNQLVTAGVLDYEMKSSYDLYVQARSPTGHLFEDIYVTVELVNVAEVLEEDVSLEENTEPGYLLWTDVSDYTGLGEGLSYEVEGEGSNNFTIDSTGKLFTATPLNYEAQSGDLINLEIVVRNSTEELVRHYLTVSLLDVQETITTTASSVREDSPVGTVIGTIVADIANYDGAVELVLPDTLDNGNFQIDASNQLVTAGVLDYEMKSSYDLYVQARSPTGHLFEELVFFINLTKFLVTSVQSKELKIFPNPASDYLKIQFYGQFQSRVVSLDGKTKIVSSEDVIDIRPLSQGVYILYVDNGSETISFKFLKE